MRWLQRIQEVRKLVLSIKIKINFKIKWNDENNKLATLTMVLTSYFFDTVFVVWVFIHTQITFRLILLLFFSVNVFLHSFFGFKFLISFRLSCVDCRNVFSNDYTQRNDKYFNCVEHKHWNGCGCQFEIVFFSSLARWLYFIFNFIKHTKVNRSEKYKEETVDLCVDVNVVARARNRCSWSFSCVTLVRCLWITHASIQYTVTRRSTHTYVNRGHFIAKNLLFRKWSILFLKNINWKERKD